MEHKLTRNVFAKKGGEEGLKAAILQTAIKIEAEAVLKQQADTGMLKNSIMWSKGWDSDTFNFPKEGGFNTGGGKQATVKIDAPNGIEAVVGTAIEYGVYQEFGTRFQPAQPYLRPAADAVRGTDAKSIGEKWGREAMQKEFAKRTQRNG